MAATNGGFGQQEQYKAAADQYPAASTATESAADANGNRDLSKDEIGWYFVEQYYTTLSRFPEKLHLFYNKRSQFVFGPEAEIASVSVGRSAIQERIKELDFQDCKVRVSNVDSQASDNDIVIQVIGETSNKSAELKKFVQTFVLAQQPSGYFVLNDIFRYIKEEGEEEVTTTQDDSAETNAPENLPEGVEMPKTLVGTEEQISSALDDSAVDKKLEEPLDIPVPVVQEQASADDVESAQAENVEEGSTIAAQSEDETPAVADSQKALAEEELKETEKPKEPETTPATSTIPAVSTAQAVQPAAPPKPMSWASRAAAAAAATPRPAVPAPKASTSPAPGQTRAAPVVAQPAPAIPIPQPVIAPSNKENESPQQAQGSGWQTAGSDHAKRQNRPQSVSAPLEKEGTMGYVRNVTEGVKTEELRATLSSFGELIYFDINRQKNCAFVEYATPAGYQAAAAANPHQLGGEAIVVEPRRPKSSAYGGSGYIGSRGGMNGRGRGGFDQGRPGSQRGGRGDFGASRGRGAPRGRGVSQPANA